MKKWNEIECYILELIRSGTLSAGDKLPSIRTMAAYQHTSVSPVAQAYRHLVEIGIIQSRPNSGYYVPSNTEEKNVLSERMEVKPEVVGRQFASYLSLTHSLTDPSGSPFASGAICTSFVQQKNIDANIIKAIKAYPNNINVQTGEIPELPELCREIAKWMISTGCKTKESGLIVTYGAMQGILLSLLACREKGDIVVVEDPGCMVFYAAIEILGLKIQRVHSDVQSGFCVEELEALLSNPDNPRVACVLLSANFSNPTGATMSQERKYALASLCEKYDIPIIEDDVLGDLYFSAYRPKPIKYYSPENVIYVSSFTKTISPVYRIGWVDAGKHTKDIFFYKSILINTVPWVVRSAITDYLKSTNSIKTIRKLRQEYKVLIDRYRNTIFECFPEGTQVSEPQGGLYLWVKLPKDVDVMELIHKARPHNISISPGCMFSSWEENRNCFRLNIAARAWDENVERDLHILGNLAVHV